MYEFKIGNDVNFIIFKNFDLGYLKNSDIIYANVIVQVQRYYACERVYFLSNQLNDFNIDLKILRRAYHEIYHPQDGLSNENHAKRQASFISVEGELNICISVDGLVECNVAAPNVFPGDEIRHLHCTFTVNDVDLSRVIEEIELIIFCIGL